MLALSMRESGSETPMTIGRIARAAGLSIDTLRFYERRGLIAKPRRNFSGYRMYRGDVLSRLSFIADAKRLGFSLREIKDLLSQGISSTLECGALTRKAEVKLVEMTAEIHRLSRLRRSLRAIVERCGGACTPGYARRRK